jgi:hypothetical protein
MNRRPHRNVCLLPYVNVETLKADPGRFLNLLYNRIEYSPEQWATYDDSLLKKKQELGGLSTVYNNSMIVIQGDDYGNLKQWNAGEAHRWSAIGFPCVILILQAQQQLFKVLRGIVERVMGPQLGSKVGNSSQTFSFNIELGLKSIFAHSNV